MLLKRITYKRKTKKKNNFRAEKCVRQKKMIKNANTLTKYDKIFNKKKTKCLEKNATKLNQI